MRCKAELLCVDPSLVERVWPLARHFIKAAIERTALSDFAAVEKDVLSGRDYLWLAVSDQTVKAAATTQLSRVGDRTICLIVACGGRANWKALLPGIEAYARAEGCSEMRIGGRPGWERALDGYASKYVILQKELN